MEKNVFNWPDYWINLFFFSQLHQITMKLNKKMNELTDWLIDYWINLFIFSKLNQITIKLQ